jgi:hypothetical protein
MTQKLNMKEKPLHPLSPHPEIPNSDKNMQTF